MKIIIAESNPDMELDLHAACNLPYPLRSDKTCDCIQLLILVLIRQITRQSVSAWKDYTLTQTLLYSESAGFCAIVYDCLHCTSQLAIIFDSLASCVNKEVDLVSHYPPPPFPVLHKL